MAETKIPAIPEPPQGTLYGFLSAVKNAVEVRLGLRGDKLDRAVTLRELFSSGVIVASAGSAVSAPEDSSTGYGSAASSYTPAVPSAPTSLATTPSTDQIFLTWDWASYAGHDVTEIWRSTSSSCDFTGLDGCTMIAVEAGKLMADVPPTSGTYYYWVRLRTTAGANSDPYPAASAGVSGAFNAGADSGTWQNGIATEITAYEASFTKAAMTSVQSHNYFAGVTGWNIGKDGSAEFNSGTFRGTLNVKSATSGARMEMTNSTLKVYDSAGTLRVKIGDLS
jgi:hypothetical protein